MREIECPVEIYKDLNGVLWAPAALDDGNKPSLAKALVSLHKSPCRGLCFPCHGPRVQAHIFVTAKECIADVLQVSFP